MRCLTLASELKKTEEVVFISREHDGHLCDLIESKGFQLNRLVKPPFKLTSTPSLEDEYSDWLGVSIEDDALETQKIIKLLDVKPDWLIVDHYALDQGWENAIRPYVAKIMVIDDLANRNHDCDLLLDQNLVKNKDSRYLGKVPKECKLLLGPQYALLQPIYAKLHKRAPERIGLIKRIMVYFGAADNSNLTGRVISTILELDLPHLLVDVILPKSHPYFTEIVEQVNKHRNIIVHDYVESLAPLMLKADLAIGACGATTWERICLKLPSLVITLAENQVSIAEELNEIKSIYWIGKKDLVSNETIKKTIKKIIQNKIKLNYFSLKNIVIDGKGSKRVKYALGINLENKNFNIVNFSFDEFVVKNCFYDELRNFEVFKFYSIQYEDILLSIVRLEKNNNYWDAFIVENLLSFQDEQFFIELAFLRLRLEKKTDVIVNFSRSLDFFSKKSLNENCSSLRINICSDSESWINPYVSRLVVSLIKRGHIVSWSHDSTLLTKADICFCLGFSQIISEEVLHKHLHVLVVHESKLPSGRGWSPLTWQILDGAESIYVSLLKAEKFVDSGVIYAQEVINLKGDELLDELRAMQGASTINLSLNFIENYPKSANLKMEQEGTPTYYRKRTPKDSKLDIDKTLKESFNLLRVCDFNKYPAFFEIKGKKYKLKIEKC